jgi:hypothetical protein
MYCDYMPSSAPELTGLKKLNYLLRETLSVT